MHRHSVDHLKQDGPRPGTLAHRGFWVRDLPRLMPLCRLRGHRPVVDGTEPFRPGGSASRWVCCDRCGVRPEPQGVLDPAEWNIGQPYTGSFDGAAPDYRGLDGYELIKAMKATKIGFHPPGPWPARPTGEVGGEVVIGRTMSGASAGIKVGNAGSEHVLAADVSLRPVGALFLHTEGYGQGIQRRLNPKGYESRVIDVGVHDGRLWWKLWAPRNSWTAGTPRWQDGSARIDPRDSLLGERRYAYEDQAGPVTAIVRMPEGDDHEVTLTLQRQRYGRRRGRRPVLSWSVQWDTPRGGIPTRPVDVGRISGSAVPVTDAAVREDHWPAEACAAIAASLTRDRSQYGWRPSTDTEAS